MSYIKQTFQKGQLLKANDLNLMSKGIVEASGQNFSEILFYTDSTQIDDESGNIFKASTVNARTVMSSFLAVNAGDSIVVNDPNIEFILYAYASADSDSFIGYIDTDPYNAASNWGQSFTFANILYLGDGKVATEMAYPLYIRITFRNKDTLSAVAAQDFKDSIEYNISADNLHLINKGLGVANVKIVSPLLTPNLIAHRGLSSVAPENTLAAAQKAFENGIKIIEADIQMTKDDIPVLLHDTTIDRTSNGSGSISDLTYSQASGYDYGSGEKLVSLKDFLNWCKARGICVELDLADKTFTKAQKKKIYDIVMNLGMLDSTIFTASSAELAEYLSFNPNIHISVSGITSMSVAQKLLPNFVNCRLVFASIPVANLTEALVHYVHTLGMKAKVWTIDSQETRDVALSYGIDNILSNELTSLY